VARTRQTAEYVSHVLTLPDASWHSLTLPGKEGQSPLNPKVQGSIPCASTNMLCLLPFTHLHVGSVCRDALQMRHLTPYLTP
jgi:hypothetical protein